jgi:hypothetical protein
MIFSLRERRKVTSALPPPRELLRRGRVPSGLFSLIFAP